MYLQWQEMCNFAWFYSYFFKEVLGLLSSGKVFGMQQWRLQEGCKEPVPPLLFCICVFSKTQVLSLPPTDFLVLCLMVGLLLTKYIVNSETFLKLTVVTVAQLNLWCVEVAQLCFLVSELLWPLSCLITKGGFFLLLLCFFSTYKMKEVPTWLSVHKGLWKPAMKGALANLLTDSRVSLCSVHLSCGSQYNGRKF